MKKLLTKRWRVAMWLLLSIVVCACETQDESADDGGDNSGPIKGVWVRTLGASGDQTDIAIGGIPNEPANRVYMCESKGNVGLYKGYIEGNTVTWDAVYGLPNASAKLKGAQLEFYYPSVSGSLPTLYNPGTWSNRCATWGGSSPITGNALFWAQKDHGCGSIMVTVSGKSGSISQYYSSGVPNCGAGGSANFELPAGTYTYSAKCSKYTWNGTITVVNGSCARMRLD